MTIEGNHEIEEDAAGKTFLSYTARYRMPSAESRSPSQLYYSFDYGGEPPQPDIVWPVQLLRVSSLSSWGPALTNFVLLACARSCVAMDGFMLTGNQDLCWSCAQGVMWS